MYGCLLEAEAVVFEFECWQWVAVDMVYDRLSETAGAEKQINMTVMNVIILMSTFDRYDTNLENKQI